MLSAKSNIIDAAIIKKLAIVWAVLFILLSITASITLPKMSFETNILELLPHEEKNTLVNKAQALQNKQFNHSIIWLVGSKTETAAVKEAEKLKQMLASSHLFQDIKFEISTSNTAEIYQTLLPYRYNFLSSEDKKAIISNPQVFSNNSIELLYSPLGMQHAATLLDDPFFTLGNYINSLNTLPFSVYKDIGIIKSDKTFYALIVSTINNEQQHKPLLALYEKTKTIFSSGDTSLLVAGLPLYSAYGADSASKEISTIGVASVIAITLLILFSFRSSLPLLLTLLSIGTGVLAAITVCNMVFERVHLITLVFGSSLIGISVDYAFHFFCDSFEKAWSSIKGLKNIFQSVSLGMMSSVIAFIILAFTPFPGLQQMALFSSVGLFTAWLTVILLFPFLCQSFSCKHALPLKKLYPVYLEKWPAFFNQYKIAFILLAAIFCAIGFTRLQPIDDVRSMQKMNADLQTQEIHIKNLFQQKNDGQFFIVSAATVTDVLRSEKHLTQQLNSLVKQEKLAAYTAISQHYPSAAEQVINRRLIKESLFDSGIAKETLKNLSMSEENINDIYSTFEKSQNTLNIEKWLESAPQNWQQQWLGCENNTCASIISLRGINDLSALASLANNTSIYWVDNVASINSILHHYRLMAALFILIAIISIAVILSFSLNIKSALMIITIPATTIILSVATLSYLGTLFNVFNVFALLLVLGIGLDYAIFHHLSAKHKQATAFAILLSMITTLLAFGLLAFSETTVIQAFGLTLSIGIIYAFLLSPLIPAQKPEVIHEQY